MVDDTARDRAIYHALKAADEVAAALQTHLIEEHGADPERAAAQSPATNSLKLLRQARERLGHGLRAIKADHIAESDEISLRNNQPRPQPHKLHPARRPGRPRPHMHPWLVPRVRLLPLEWLFMRRADGCLIVLMKCNECG